MSNAAEWTEEDQARADFVADLACEISADEDVVSDVLGALEERGLVNSRSYRATPLPYTNNWQPMETAPKTGAQIIYRYMDGPYVRAGLMEWRFCTDDDGQSCWWDVGIDDEPYKPTGWVPFPGGPAPEPHGLQKTSGDVSNG